MNSNQNHAHLWTWRMLRTVIVIKNFIAFDAKHGDIILKIEKN